MSTIKINWGTRIVLLYAGFVMLTVTLVYKSMRTDFDLVSNDYYNEELKYQEIIDAGKNQATLSAPVQIEQQGNIIQFKFPPEFTGTTMTGSVHFYSAINEEWDRQYTLNTINGQSRISSDKLKHGQYTAKIRWTHNGKAYYQETSIKTN